MSLTIPWHNTDECFFFSVVFHYFWNMAVLGSLPVFHISWSYSWPHEFIKAMFKGSKLRWSLWTEKGGTNLSRTPKHSLLSLWGYYWHHQGYFLHLLTNTDRATVNTCMNWHLSFRNANVAHQISLIRNEAQGPGWERREHRTGERKWLDVWVADGLLVLKSWTMTERKVLGGCWTNHEMNTRICTHILRFCSS